MRGQEANPADVRQNHSLKKSDSKKRRHHKRSDSESPALRASKVPSDSDRQRPRERLARLGSSALSDSELLAILLGTGVRGVNSLELAERLLRRWHGLEGLIGRSSVELQEPGVGPGKSATICAAIELGRRLHRTARAERPVLRAPTAVARYLDLRYRQPSQEVMGALLLDTRGRLLAERELFRGGLSRACVEPLPILKEAILHGAAGILLFHTHPSGDPSPSLEDVEFTRRLNEAAAVIGVKLLDHLVIGHEGRWVSLRSRGAF